MPGILNLGTRAMFAAQAQLSTTASNISNANTPGYSRQSVQLQSAGGQFSGAGYFGKGVDVAGITRAHNAFLSREVATTHALAAADGARLSQLERLEQVFDMGESGLGHAVGQLLNAFTDVASRPADTSARQVVLARVEDFASRMRSAAGELDSLQAGVTQEVQTSVKAVNVLAQRVADLNQDIARVQGLGYPPNDLLDQRDQAIKEINGYVQVTQIPAGDGTVGLFIGGGQRLVLGNQTLELRALPDAHDAAIVRLGVREAGVDRRVPEGSVTGGSIAGLLRFQRHDLGEAQNQLGRMAAVMSDVLNRQQAAGLDLGGRNGAPLLTTGAARVLPSVHNQGQARLHLAIEDSKLLQASDYELLRDGEDYQLTRLSDGAAVPQAGARFTADALAAGVSVDGLQIRIERGEAASGDRFLLQPLRQAGGGTQRVMDDPLRLAAAAPVTATLPMSNRGTLAVVSLVQRSPDTTPGEGVELVVRAVDPVNGSITYSLGGAEHTVEAGEFITHHGWEMKFAGTPLPGDVIQLNRTRAVAASNGNALAMLALRDVPLVGQRLNGAQPQGGETITDAYASLLGDIGVRVQGGRAAAATSRAVARDAEAARNNESGVNLDEEAARLIQYQQAYQAAAKVLQVAQSVFDTLLQTAGR